MTMISGPPTDSLSGDEYHLALKTAVTKAGSTRGVTSFMASLDANSRTGVDLSGLAGILVDTDAFRRRPITVTIHEALRRHTGPKSFSVSSGAVARSDLDGGVDGRVQTATRHVLFLWLPEIYDEGRRKAGTMLIDALRAFLKPWPDITVLLDLGVEGELTGFVRIFWPGLRSRGLEPSADGRFARGVWPEGENRQRRPCEVGFVHL